MSETFDDNRHSEWLQTGRNLGISNFRSWAARAIRRPVPATAPQSSSQRFCHASISRSALAIRRGCSGPLRRREQIVQRTAMTLRQYLARDRYNVYFLGMYVVGVAAAGSAIGWVARHAPDAGVPVIFV
jgi:hypothetical protein